MAVKAWARAALAGLLMASVPAAAQDSVGNYPNRPVTFVVPYPAGGGLDVFARQLAQRLSERHGQAVRGREPAGRRNRHRRQPTSPRRRPMATRIMLGTSSAFAINVTLNKSLPYDPGKAFRADHLHLGRAVPVAGAFRCAGQDRGRVDQVGQGATEAAVLRHGRAGLAAAHQHGAAQDA